VNGWELTGLLTLASGQPNFESVTFSSTANLPQAFTTTLNGLGGDSNTGISSQGFSAANKGTAAAPNFVIAPCATATASVCAPTTPGLGTLSGGFPDGTNARRAQAGLRFVF
jgi:hypothetical protein